MERMERAIKRGYFRSDPRREEFWKKLKMMIKDKINKVIQAPQESQK